MTAGPGPAPHRGSSNHALVLADGDVPARADLDAAWPGWADGLDLVVAADGGARHAATLGLAIDRWVGDGDSTAPDALAALAAAGVPIERTSTDKDESDTELATLAAVAAGPARITVLGAFGGSRLDHALANIALLGHPGLAGCDVRLLDGTTRLRLLAGPASLDLSGPIGATVSLLPLGGDAEGVTTRGLRYPLRDEDLIVGPARGLSNVRVAEDAGVTLRVGRLLVVERPVTLTP